MMKNNLSYADGWKRNLRAWKIWWSLCPGVFLSVFLHSVVKALSPYVTIWLSAQLINELAGRREPQVLFKWVLLQLAAGSVMALLGGILMRWSNYESGNASRIENRIYMEKILSLDYADMDRQEVFDLYSQIRQNEAWAKWGILSAKDYLEPMATAIFQVMGGVFLSISLFTAKVPENSSMAFLNHPVCVAVTFGILLLFALTASVCSNRIGLYSSRYAPEALLGNRYFSFYGWISKDRNRAVDLRMYSQQENVCNVYMDRNDSFTHNSLIAKWARGPMGLLAVLSQCISVVLTGVVYLFVCLKAWGGAFGVGSVTQYVGAITNLFFGISTLLEYAGKIRTNGEFLAPCFELLDFPNKMYQGSLTTEKRSDRQYQVEFKDVSFKYPGSDRWALRHVNMKFRVGSRLAVVGMNGSGKTTFIKLLCRLYDPTEGEILLNDIDIRKYKYDDYINIFSVVFQDFKLLALPLGENVAGRSEYDRERVLKCLRDAGFETRLDTMPKGLDTYLYKDLDVEGMEISGGEAQKIAIARALYKNAPFIILDEPTAALDPIAEAEIYSKFNDIAGDRTAIYISHRLSSCKFCDEIAVFHEGAVIQQGSHLKLLADESGMYYRLWNAQAQYYTE